MSLQPCQAGDTSGFPVRLAQSLYTNWPSTDKSQEKLKNTPEYILVKETGLAHKKKFEVSVRIDGVEYGIGSGTSKKRASQEAARAAMENLLQNNLRERT